MIAKSLLRKRDSNRERKKEEEEKKTGMSCEVVSMQYSFSSETTAASSCFRSKAFLFSGKGELLSMEEESTECLSVFDISAFTPP